MKYETLFPATMIVLSLGASVMYWSTGDIHKVIYWAAAAIVTATVTF